MSFLCCDPDNKTAQLLNQVFSPSQQVTQSVHVVACCCSLLSFATTWTPVLPCFVAVHSTPFAVVK